MSTNLDFLTEEIYEKVVFAMFEIAPTGNYNGDLLQDLSTKTGVDKNMCWRAVKRYRLENKNPEQSKPLL
jgi:hypothetical protein